MQASLICLRGNQDDVYCEAKVCSVQCAVYIAVCSVQCSVQCAICSVQFLVWSVQCTVSSVQCIVIRSVL